MDHAINWVNPYEDSNDPEMSFWEERQTDVFGHLLCVWRSSMGEFCASLTHKSSLVRRRFNLGEQVKTIDDACIEAEKLALKTINPK